MRENDGSRVLCRRSDCEVGERRDHLERERREESGGGKGNDERAEDGGEVDEGESDERDKK